MISVDGEEYSLVIDDTMAIASGTKSQYESGELWNAARNKIAPVGPTGL